jgi:hypothetical protein
MKQCPCVILGTTTDGQRTVMVRSLKYTRVAFATVCVLAALQLLMKSQKSGPIQSRDRPTLSRCDDAVTADDGDAVDSIDPALFPSKLADRVASTVSKLREQVAVDSVIAVVGRHRTDGTLKCGRPTVQYVRGRAEDRDLAGDALENWDSSVLRAARRALSNGAWAGSIPVGTVVHINLESLGVFCASRGLSALRRATKLAAAHPDVFWVTWRPCLRQDDDDAGNIGPNEVVIPPPQEAIPMPAPAKAVRTRPPCVSWRGYHYAPKNVSIVAAFQHVVGTDVRFSLESGIRFGETAMRTSHSYAAEHKSQCRVQLDVADAPGDSQHGIGTASLAWKLRSGGIVVHVTRPDADDVTAEWYYPLLQSAKAVYVVEGSDESSADGDRIRARVVRLAVGLASLHWTTPANGRLHHLELAAERAKRLAADHLSEPAVLRYTEVVMGDLRKAAIKQDWRLHPNEEYVSAITTALPCFSPYRDLGSLGDPLVPIPTALPHEVEERSDIFSPRDRRSIAATVDVARAIEDSRLKQGLVAVALLGEGRFCGVRLATMVNVGGRLGSRAANLAFETARWSLPAGTVLTYRLEDIGVYCSAEGRAIARQLNNRYPTLYWLSYNPCVVDPATGRIGEREVPIPGYDAHESNPDGVRAVRSMTSVARKKPRVVWRGVTTGHFSDYRKSPRYQLVAAFEAARGNGSRGVDVRFSGRVQKVKPTVVIPDWMGRHMSAAELAEYLVQIDVDGNANSWEGLRWKLFSGSAVVKLQSRFVQWYYPRLVNGTHLLVVDTAADAVKAALRLISDPPAPATTALVQRLANYSYQFAERYLERSAVDKQLVRIVARMVEDYDPERDWRPQTNLLDYDPDQLISGDE